ncbi:MAG: rhamnulose-1-phosphate aldolase [Bacteroidales bacterium]|nr:rhamnulose-1-phosphate aldolase [Bacteroidales bacterium]
MSILDKNAALAARVEEAAEVAGYLWTKGWAERNGGNLTIDVTELAEFGEYAPIAGPFGLGVTLRHLKGRYFFCKGTGKRMRDLARAPMHHGSIISILPSCDSYEIIADEAIMPTSELVAHLMAQDMLTKRDGACHATLHAHPTELTAMSHNDDFLGRGVLTRLLWSMIPEAKMFCPKGLGVLPYQKTGTLELACDTAKMLEEYDVVLWEKHGVFVADKDILSAFDQLDVLNKSALIYQSACTMGFAPSGLTNRQLEELAGK